MAGFRRVTRCVPARDAADGAGVRLKRSLGTPMLDHLDPFLLLDEIKSDQAGDYIAGFPDHPHRGFETVTYVLAGSVEHRDHAGNQGNLVAGSVQWMTAGRGIIHSEMPKQHEGLLWGFQLWVNLPAANKMCEPRYQDIPPEQVPEHRLAGGVQVRILAGSCDGVVGPIRDIVTEPTYLDVSIPAGARFEQVLPPQDTTFCYVFEGEGSFGGDEADAGQTVAKETLAIFSPGERLLVRAGDTAVRFLLLSAQAIGEPIARYGPFVMNTREEILQAFHDYQTGRLMSGQA